MKQTIIKPTAPCKSALTPTLERPLRDTRRTERIYGNSARGAISSKDTRPAISGISQIASSRHVSLSPMFQGVHRESLVRMVEDYRWRPISPSTKGREQWIFRSEGLSTARYPPSASPPSPAVDDVQLDLVPAQAVKPSPKAMFT